MGRNSCQRDYWAAHVSMYKEKLVYTEDYDQRKILIDKIRELGEEISKIDSQADHFMSVQGDTVTALRTDLRDYLTKSGIRDAKGLLTAERASPSHKRDLRQLLGSLEEMGKLKEQVVTRYNLKGHLKNLEGGSELSIYFDCFPENFGRVQELLEDEAKGVAHTKFFRVFGKKANELHPTEKLLISQGKLLTIRHEDFSEETVSNIATETCCTVEEVKTVIKWRLKYFPEYFTKTYEDICSEEMIGRSQPYARSEFYKPVFSFLSPGYGKIDPRDSWPLPDLEKFNVQIDFPIEKDLVKVTLQDTKQGIFDGDKFLYTDAEVKSINMTHWSKISKRPVFLAQKLDDVRLQSLLSRDGSPEEAQAKWVVGLKRISTSCSGINTPLAISQADSLRWSDLAKTELSVCCHNVSLGTKSDLINVLWDGASTLRVERDQVRVTTLSIKQTWMAYFKNNPDGEVIHTCHSGGAAHTLSALKEMPAELRNRIKILAIAPQVIIGDEWCKKVIHVGTDRDLIYSRAKKANTDTNANIITVSSKAIRDQDHANRSFTLKSILIDSMEELLK